MRGKIIGRSWAISQIAKFMGPTRGPPGSYRLQMGSMLAQEPPIRDKKTMITAKHQWKIRNKKLKLDSHTGGKWFICGPKTPQGESVSKHTYYMNMYYIF